GARGPPRGRRSGLVPLRAPALRSPRPHPRLRPPRAAGHGPRGPHAPPPPPPSPPHGRGGRPRPRRGALPPPLTPGMAAAPELSVVLACYNEAEILESSFAEIRDTLEELKRPYETFSTAAASRDRTRDLIAKIVRDNPALDLKVILHERNRGRGQTVTDGFRAA